MKINIKERGEKILTVIRFVPFLGSAFSFPPRIALRSVGEILILWFISTMPIFFSLLPSIHSGESLAAEIEKEINAKVLLVYTSAFLAPVLYLLISRLIYPKTQKIFSGAAWIFVATLAIICASCWLYQNDKIQDPSQWRTTCYWIYGASIYFWWLAISDDRNSGFEFESAARRDEDNFAVAAAARSPGGAT
jgi:hypothetical protein